MTEPFDEQAERHKTEIKALDTRPTSVPVENPEPLELLEINCREDIERVWEEARRETSSDYFATRMQCLWARAKSLGLDRRPERRPGKIKRRGSR